MQARLDELCREAVKEKVVPGIAAISLDSSGNVIYRGSFGTVNIDDPSAAAVLSSTPMAIFSLTKLVTSVAALQLLEQGRLSLDDLVEKYVPAIREIPILEGFSAEVDGGSSGRQPIFRPSRTKATVLHLMTHTSGFTYDWMDSDTRSWREWRERRFGTSSHIIPDTRSYCDVPFSYDPGTGFSYGHSTDWLGFVIEAISGIAVEKYIEDHILKPLRMSDTGLSIIPQLLCHIRGSDGKLQVVPADPRPSVALAGHYLVSTVDDYSKFLLTILNQGTHPHSGTQILRPETVREYLFKGQTHRMSDFFGPNRARKSQQIGRIKSSNALVATDGDLLPCNRKAWSCGLMITEDEVLGRRSRGSGSWCGLHNSHYWIDPIAGKLGLVMTSILPFMDKEVLRIFDQFETVIYKQEDVETTREKL